MANDKQYVIVGGGGFGREVACWVLDVLAAQPGSVVGFIDDEPKDISLFPSAVKHVGGISDFAPRPEHVFLLAIGTPRVKRDVVAKLRARGAKFGTLRHPTAVVAATATVGEGAILCPYTVVSASGAVGEFVTVNIASSVGHDVRVGAYSTLASHVDLMGGVVVGGGVNIGSGARVLPGLRVGDDATLGAGAIVMRNVEGGTTVYAAAAKRL